jgi:hypothetical protein
MHLPLDFILTFDDYLDAQRLHSRRGWWPRVNWLMTGIGFPIWGVLILAFAFLIHGPGVGWEPIVFMSACGIFLLAYPFYVRFKLKRCFIRTRIDSGECSIELGDDIIRTHSSATRSEIEWKAVRSFRESKKVILLYLAPAKFILIPKRVCSAGQTEELRGLIQSRLKSASA